MNVTGLLFGFGAALALVAAAGSAFAGDARRGIAASGAASLGVALMCLSFGSDLVAVVVGVVLGVAVPAVLLAAAAVAPPPLPDHRPGPARLVLAAALVLALFAALGWALTQTPWPPAAGPRDLTAPWLGWRLLTDDLPALVLSLALLGVAGVAAGALLRARAPRAGRPPGGAA